MELCGGLGKARRSIRSPPRLSYRPHHKVQESNLRIIIEITLSLMSSVCQA